MTTQTINQFNSLAQPNLATVIGGNLDDKKQ